MSEEDFQAKLQNAFTKLTELEEAAAALNQEQDVEERRLLWKFEQKRKAVLYDPRKELIKDIPKFWSTAFDNHPELSSLLEVQDQEVMQNLEDIDLQAHGDVELESFDITFTFAPNPFFNNRTLTKKFTFDNTRKIIGANKQAIDWKAGKSTINPPSNLSGAGRKRKNEEIDTVSFFTWFDDDSLETNAVIAALFYDDLWPRAFEYFQGVQEDEDAGSPENDYEEDDGQNEDDEDNN